MALPLGLWYLHSDHIPKGEAPLNVQHPRSDRTSVEVKASGAFTASEVLVTSFVDVRDYPGGAVFWLIPGASLGSVTEVTLKCYGSDDGSTIPVAVGGPVIPSDDGIAEGAFPPLPYTAVYSTADGTLVVNKPCAPFRIPQVAGQLRLSVTGNHASGLYSVRAQRLS